MTHPSRWERLTTPSILIAMVVIIGSLVVHGLRTSLIALRMASDARPATGKTVR
ncbi:hypothetical protein [Williamsia muralis]|uniref:hypothetical protein n=1 Tax=Williamsia marianensis TaxID=85044 RepID=UPI000B02C2AC|nr:hypothetical protein [Williamsia muralis]